MSRKVFFVHDSVIWTCLPSKFLTGNISYHRFEVLLKKYLTKILSLTLKIVIMKTQLINLFALVFVASLFVACEKDTITGIGEITTQTLQVNDITGINFEVAGSVILTQGPIQQITATGHSNIISKIKTNVSNDIWKIDFEDKDRYDDYELTIEITLPNVSDVKLSGAGDIVLNDFYDQDNLSLDIPGAGSIELHKFTGIDELEVDVNGHGMIKGNETITGLNLVDINYRGSGKYEGMLIQSKEYDINISGAADCLVHATDQLNVRITGSGVISYKGHPVIDEKITGAGSVVDMN
jgi:hypothetical protein